MLSGGGVQSNVLFFFTLVAALPLPHVCCIIQKRTFWPFIARFRIALALFFLFFVCSSSAISCGWNHTCSVSLFLPAESVTSPHVPSRTIDASALLPLFSFVFSCLSFGVLPSSPTVIIARLFVCSPAAGPHGEVAQINSLPWQAARLLYIPLV